MFIPILINLDGFNVCIFGFGNVGIRRFKKILVANPKRITIYDKNITYEKVVEILCDIDGAYKAYACVKRDYNIENKKNNDKNNNDKNDKNDYRINKVKINNNINNFNNYYNFNEINNFNKGMIYKNCQIIIKKIDLKSIPDEELKNIIKSNHIIITTLTEDINKKIVNICRSMKKFVNSSTFEEDINLIIPAMCIKEGVYFSIYTNGKSPMVAKNVRKLVEQYLDNYNDDLVIQNLIRNTLKNTVPNQKDRVKILEKIYNNKDFKEKLLKLIEEYK